MFKKTENSRSIISHQSKIVGDIELHEELELNGFLHGNIISSAAIRLNTDANIIGNVMAASLNVNSGRIEGDILCHTHFKSEVLTEIKGNIKAESAIISGTIYGNVSIQKLLTLDSSAKVIGTIEASEIKVLNGALFNGEVNIRGNLLD